MTKVLALLLLCSPLLAQSAQEIIQKVEDNLRGESAQMELSMIVHTSRGKRTMKMQSYSVGDEKSFIKILYPLKDRGITFLKIDDTMWQYVPRIERIIKIPASMMLQSWMGSDFSNDDLVKESSIAEDYRQKLLASDAESYTLELLPKEQAAVVWGRLQMRVSKKYFLPTEVKYYDEKGTLIRILSYKEVKKLGDRFYPTYWVMLPQTEEKKGRKTEVIVKDATFNEAIDPAYFTKRALKRFSR